MKSDSFPAQEELTFGLTGFCGRCGCVSSCISGRRFRSGGLGCGFGRCLGRSRFRRGRRGLCECRAQRQN